jgi:hypothetical protein
MKKLVLTALMLSSSFLLNAANGFGSAATIRGVVKNRTGLSGEIRMQLPLETGLIEKVVGRIQASGNFEIQLPDLTLEPGLTAFNSSSSECPEVKLVGAPPRAAIVPYFQVFADARAKTPMAHLSQKLLSKKSVTARVFVDATVGIKGSCKTGGVNQVVDIKLTRGWNAMTMVKTSASVQMSMSGEGSKANPWILTKDAPTF